ncbi:hypothetical protein QG516_00285 [Pedobacter gandavensis]|uniref:hypothetical protein n=1 Tax=Pedobacter TaxID=84567 RepID=UPI001C9A09BA|nr:MULTISPECIES: hypothetical protein [Pedobacter]WGQ10091.1 hypothetical protein QG516_00285 [Pedobacter gandavensis]
MMYKPVVVFASAACAQNDKIYHKGWIDFNNFFYVINYSISIRATLNVQIALFGANTVE